MEVLCIVLLTIGGMLACAAGMGLSLSDPESRVTKTEIVDFFFITGAIASVRQLFCAIWRGIRHRHSPELALVVLLSVGLAMVFAAIFVFFLSR